MPSIIPVRRNVLHRAVPAAFAATTWNNSDKTAGLTLSNSNRTATNGAGGNTNQAIRSVASTTSNQKAYIEHVIGVITSNFTFGFAVIGGSLALGPSLPAGSPTLAFGCASATGKFSDADSVQNTANVVPAFTAGDRLGIAFNSGAMLAWFRKNGGTWNVTSGGGDPVAGTGGMSVVLTGSPFFAWCGLDAFPADQFTTNFAATDWVDSAPTGYTQLA